VAENALDLMIFVGKHPPRQRPFIAQDLTKALDETAQAGPATKKPRHEGGGGAGGE
tara:strand:- start:237 stop:404 length:168 start_codon:yes stop_codon:yes gene_type:complete